MKISNNCIVYVTLKIVTHKTRSSRLIYYLFSFAFLSIALVLLLSTLADIITCPLDIFKYAYIYIYFQIDMS